MEDFAHSPAEGVKDHEWVMSVSLKTFENKLWGASQAMVRRSALRSRMGDRKGALQDAQAALGMLPERAEYLVRAAEALLDDGQHEQASEVFQRAASAVEKVNDKQKAFLQACVSRLDRRLQPFEHMPNEVLALIFERVQADWEQLPSPFQLAHVCFRWRELALSTPSLWRDTRNLRVATKLATVDSGLSYTIRRPPCFPSESATPPVRYVHPRGGNHLKMIEFCARKSRNTLTHYEIETLNNDPECRVFADAMASAATLESLSVINKTEGSSMYSDALDLVARCPKLAALELSLGDMEGRDASKLREFAKAGLTTAPSFRMLKLHNFDLFNHEPELEVQQLFLQRCSQIESLTILDDECREPPLGLSQFIQQLLVRCADTLVNLETSGRASIFEGAQRAGLTTLPKLRRFKNVDFAHPERDHLDLDVDEFNFPQLEEIEGPYNIATSFPVLPKRYIFRVYDREDFAKIAEWLCDLEDYESPYEITVQAVDTMRGPDALPKLVDALTPSKAGRVVCPKLTSFAYLQKDEIYRRGPESSPFAWELVPARMPQFLQETLLMVDASCIAAMDTERRRVSEGLPPVAAKAKRESRASCSPQARSQQQAAAANDDDDGGEEKQAEESKVWAPCEPLRSVTIEGCAVQYDVWSAMKTSPVCRYKVTPDPHEMSQLYPGPSNDRGRVYSDYCSF